MIADFRPCVLIPTYNNARTLRAVVEQARSHLADVVVIDDGSAIETRTVAEALAREGLATVHHRERNGGKGAAVKDGLRVADTLGYSHALQVDADGQHTIADIPRFIEAARQRPEAVILGEPIFDASAPRSRMLGRRFTQMWTNLETSGRVIADPMCGFRVYPVRASITTRTWGDMMDFDPKIAVRLVWAGVPVVNLPTRVRYIPLSEGGVSHFRMFRDNALISWMHTRMVVGRILRIFTYRAPRQLP